MWLLFLACLLCTALIVTDCQTLSNERPIIGVVTEELNYTNVKDAKSMIVANYVQFLEAGGARVIPIWIYKPREYYEDIISKINGVLFPGGGVPLSGNGYGQTGQIIYDIATKMNDKGDYFPMWGTCLGFELLNFVVAKKDFMKRCDAQDLSTSIEFSNGYKNSKMFSDLDENLNRSMQKQKVAIHYHRWCLTSKNYTLSGLNKYFKVLAVNKDKENTTFVSIIEAFKYPFYGVSFHPEKVLFEWVLSKTHQNIPHNLDAIRTSQYFANFFVNEARKSHHHFPNKKAEDEVLIYNYNPVFTGKYNANTQTYFFQ
ncbi:hypothetical protein JTE90_009091 [Oedothorax gibbosus]|uniref:folate gamma-glutamyl hydrolase n=1 Tax=Oedothorax gibbosus TaxID=931172 RepID=A0AAV6V0A6_9ARAC|nr:hypothetical protein JTE90_009091 [Oedothorax gibbosus]